MTDLKDKIDLVQNGELINAETLNRPVESLADQVDIKFSEFELVIQEGFTPDERAKLAGIAAEATKNRADSANADKVHTHTTAQVTGLDTTLDGKASTTDSRFTDAREWSAATVSQLVAESGTSTDRLAFTPQRVR